MQHLISASSLVLALSRAIVALAEPSATDKFTVIRHARDLKPSYDYIVVGGGTAGLTVADRLSEDGKITVLVIEHGDLVDSPLIDNVATGKQAWTGQFLYPTTSVPQTFLRGHQATVMAGKVVGGSSAVNTMMTVRGTVEDYDRWERYWAESTTPSSPASPLPTELASYGWTWEGLLPYFKKALHFVAPATEVATSSNITYDPRWWGNTSTVYAAWPTYQFPGVKVLVDAFRTLPGIEFPPDSGAGGTGVYWFPTFMDPRSVNRSYARTGHYDAARRDNYQLLASSKVLRVLFDQTATAIGVSFIAAQGNTDVKTVAAVKEVIISAGAVHSPQVLQRSGVGPRQLLKSANITTVVDLPGVGQNFQDHTTIPMVVNLHNYTISPSLNDLTNNATFQAWANATWAANRTGPNSLAISNAAAWLPIKAFSNRSAEFAELVAKQDPAALLPNGTHPTVVAGYAAQLRSLRQAMTSGGTSFLNAVLKGGPASGFLCLLHPLSRGSITIDPADPFGGEPLVDWRAMSNPLDGLVMAEMVRFMRRYWFGVPALAALGPAEQAPGSRVQSDEALVDWLADTLSPTEYHPSGTCSMLPLELGGVVDRRLRVYGTSRLRVVDASVFPTLPGANTCQTVYAVAEKAADMIKEDLPKPS